MYSTLFATRNTAASLEKEDNVECIEPMGYYMLGKGMKEED